MKTNQSARRVWRLRLVIGCVVIAATGLFDVWVIRYCFINPSITAAPQTQSEQLWNGRMAGSDLFLAVR